jgi:hypothetical protein
MLKNKAILHIIQNVNHDHRFSEVHQELCYDIIMSQNYLKPLFFFKKKSYYSGSTRKAHHDQIPLRKPRVPLEMLINYFPQRLQTLQIMTSSLSDFMLSLPVNLALVSDNAKSAAQPDAPPTTKPSRWTETKVSVSLPKAPKASSRSQEYHFVLDEPCACSMPPKMPQRSADVSTHSRKKVLVSHAA